MPFLQKVAISIIWRQCPKTENSEIRYVGGCVRKIINKEEVDDIDLAVNINPSEVCQCLQNNDIEYYESGIF